VKAMAKIPVILMKAASYSIRIGNESSFAIWRQREETVAKAQCQRIGVSMAFWPSLAAAYQSNIGRNQCGWRNRLAAY
jgi:hypothetical protein